MSDEGQDVELRVLVAQTLENNGVLSKIRAELRASVFLALEEQDGAVKTQILNKPFTEFVSSAEGSLVLSLVRELLEFFELTYTLSVFDPETRCGQDYHYGGRGQLIGDLKLKSADNGRKAPLLAEVLRLAREVASQREESPTKTSGDKTSRVSPAHSPLSPSHSLLSHAHSPPASNHSACNHSPSNHSTTNGLGNHRPPTTDGSLAYSKARDDSTAPTNHNQAASAFPLLGDLPPLSSNPGKTNDVARAQRKDLNVGLLNSQLLGLGLTDSPPADNNYDEDFNSSPSADDEPAVDKGSDSEIEEDINSSNHSVVDDVIIDATLSNSSGVADYMEDITNSVGATYPKVNSNTK